MKTLGFALTTENEIETKQQTTHDLAKDIMNVVMKHRRLVKQESCKGINCTSCMEPHINKITKAITLGKPIHFVLPAFPGKSPNPAKVFGTLPDMAERLALQFLNQLCVTINNIYSPGARITLTSDGRVFSDIIGMRENDVTQYLNEIDVLITELKLRNLNTFSLDEIYSFASAPSMRRQLMEEFGSSLESLRESVKRGGNGSEDIEDQEAHRIYCGITRFLVEDSTHPENKTSRTAIQKDCRARAYEVILRSNAWSRLIADKFPDAVRLSIHPQTCASKKLGIKLLGDDTWMTPWHGVAVESAKGFTLMKRWQAELLGGDIVLDSNNRPSHFKIPKEIILGAHL